MAHIYVSAAHKSSGKTVIATGICAALRGRGISVQPFKKAPTTSTPCGSAGPPAARAGNLDFYTMAPAEIIAAGHRYGSDADINVIEGTKGLHDGVAVDGSDSNAALAKLLAAPVLCWWSMPVA